MQKADLSGSIVQFIDNILLDAIDANASDIHFEPYHDSYRIRFRQDGMLVEKISPPVKQNSVLTARLKILANLDIAERRTPQDGRFQFKVSDKRIVDFRVNTCPTIHGEKIVLRLLESCNKQLDLDTLGMNPKQIQLFLESIHRSQGMILVTGPTGSGKTITLYTALHRINATDKNISTVEDPIEIQFPGINQVQMNTKSGMHFSTALRAFLRQDPDIIMIGEIRDLETAEVSVKAAQTGHLVLSTLHTTSASEAVMRLVNMGIATYNIVSSICLIVAQRLVRRLCDHCKIPANLPKKILLEEGFREEDLANGELFNPVGCDKCTNGYKGRVGIFEVLPITPSMQHIIMSQHNVLAMAEQAQREGITNLRQSGLEKTLLGLTSLAEVNRIIKG